MGEYTLYLHLSQTYRSTIGPKLILVRLYLNSLPLQNGMVVSWNLTFSWYVITIIYDLHYVSILFWNQFKYNKFSLYSFIWLVLSKNFTVGPSDKTYYFAVAKSQSADCPAVKRVTSAIFVADLAFVHFRLLRWSYIGEVHREKLHHFFFDDNLLLFSYSN